MSLVCDEAGALIVVKMDQLREYLADPVQYSKKMSVSKRIYTKAQKKFQENMKEMKFSLRKLFFFFFSWKLNSMEILKTIQGQISLFHQDLWSVQEFQDVSLEDSMVETARSWQDLWRVRREFLPETSWAGAETVQVDLDHWLKSVSWRICCLMGTVDLFVWS